MTHRDRVAPEKTARFEFSFSGIKTSVLRYVRGQRVTAEGEVRGIRGEPPAHPRDLSDAEVRDIAASFQRVVVETLLERTFAAARWAGARSVGIAGGVSANSRLRSEAAARGMEAGLPVFVPSLHLSTDNAAMIAAAGLRRFHDGIRAEPALNADAALAL
jgi:N6-L-threonylcarbamoyladenine synthase